MLNRVNRRSKKQFFALMCFRRDHLSCVISYLFIGTNPSTTLERCLCQRTDMGVMKYEDWRQRNCTKENVDSRKDYNEQILITAVCYQHNRQLNLLCLKAGENICIASLYLMSYGVSSSLRMAVMHTGSLVNCLNELQPLP